MPKISVVIPCYFNEANIPVTTAALLKNEQLFPADVEFEYVFVDDGSGDGTLRELIRFHNSYPEKVKVISLTENVGSYNAICAGFEYVTGDCIVVMSADLQDPPSLIYAMYQKWQTHAKLVLAVRTRRNDTLITKAFAALFYTVLRFSNVPIPNGGFDYCLFDASLLPHLKKRLVPDINVLLLLLSLDKTPVLIPYERRKREIGHSKWTFTKKLSLAINTLFYFVFNHSKSKSLYHIKQTMPKELQ